MATSHILKLIRESRGLSLEALSESSGVIKEHLTQAEENTGILASEELESVLTSLHVTKEDFDQLAREGISRGFYCTDLIIGIAADSVSAQKFIALQYYWDARRILQIYWPEFFRSGIPTS